LLLKLKELETRGVAVPEDHSHCRAEAEQLALEVSGRQAEWQ
jgi:hypothetical protein